MRGCAASCAPQCGWLGQAVFPLSFTCCSSAGSQRCSLRTSEVESTQVHGQKGTAPEGQGAALEGNSHLPGLAVHGQWFYLGCGKRSVIPGVAPFVPLFTLQSWPALVTWSSEPTPGTRVTGGTGLGVVSAPPTQRGSIPGFSFLLLKKKPNRSFSWISNIPTA